MKYTIIKNEKQYEGYCKGLEKFLIKNNEKYEDEIGILTLLIDRTR